MPAGNMATVFEELLWQWITIVMNDMSPEKNQQQL
jgi:hypothetical protein